jgi:hypothetical protein
LGKASAAPHLLIKQLVQIIYFNKYLEDGDLFGLEWSGFDVTTSLLATAFLFVAALLFAAAALFVALWGVQRLISQLKSTPVQITYSLAQS